MRNEHFCPDCDGVAVIAWGKRADGKSDWIIVSRDCDPECEVSDADLLADFDSAAEAAWLSRENSYYADHGPLSLDEQLRKARLEK